MTTTLIILLLLLGLILIVLEIMIIPGAIVGIFGVGIMIFGIYQSYVAFGDTGGNITLLITAVVTGATIIYIFRSRSWERLAIKDTLTGKANYIEEGTINVGDKGKTISNLRPMGTAIINGLRIEVRSKGSAIPSQTEVEIVKIDGNRIIVQELNN